MRKRTTGPSASCSNALVPPPERSRSRNPPRSLAAAGTNDWLRKKWRVSVLPGWSCRRWARRKLATASSTRPWFALRPSTMCQRSTRRPRRSSLEIGRRSAKLRARPRSVRPTNSNVTLARAMWSWGRWRSRTTRSRSTAPARPKALSPGITTSAAAWDATKLGYACSVRRAPAHTPGSRPRPARRPPRGPTTSAPHARRLGPRPVPGRSHVTTAFGGGHERVAVSTGSLAFGSLTGAPSPMVPVSDNALYPLARSPSARSRARVP